MNLIEIFLKELEQEAQITRKMLAIVPNDSYNWQPHPKSMTVARLASHVAEIFEWIPMCLTTSELDFATSEKPEVFYNTTDVLADFEKNLVDARAQLQASTEDDLNKPWTPCPIRCVFTPAKCTYPRQLRPKRR
jgi:hypothetical protein